MPAAVIAVIAVGVSGHVACMVCMSGFGHAMALCTIECGVCRGAEVSGKDGLGVARVRELDLS